MARQFERIGDDHRAFIAAQPLFFTASAAADGRVNVSPKGMHSLRVAGPDRVRACWDQMIRLTIDGAPTGLFGDET